MHGYRLLGLVRNTYTTLLYRRPIDKRLEYGNNINNESEGRRGQSSLQNASLIFLSLDLQKHTGMPTSAGQRADIRTDPKSKTSIDFLTDTSTSPSQNTEVGPVETLEHRSTDRTESTDRNHGADTHQQSSIPTDSGPTFDVHRTAAGLDYRSTPDANSNDPPARSISPLPLQSQDRALFETSHEAGLALAKGSGPGSKGQPSLGGERGDRAEAGRVGQPKGGERVISSAEGQNVGSTKGTSAGGRGILPEATAVDSTTQVTSSPSSNVNVPDKQVSRTADKKMYFLPGPLPATYFDRRNPAPTSSTPTTSDSHASQAPSNGASASNYASNTDATPALPSASLSSLPHDILSTIAYHIVATSPSSHPGRLSAALLSCKAFHQAASFETNPQLYHDLFLHTFDYAAMRRRYKWMKGRLIQARRASIANERAGAAAGGASVMTGQRSTTGNRDGIGADRSGTADSATGANGTGNDTANATGSTNGTKQSASTNEDDKDKPLVSPAAMQSKQTFDLFSDPRSWAMDYKERWITAKRMRLNVRRQSMVVEGVCNREDMMADLWNIWFLLTENGTYRVCL